MADAVSTRTSKDQSGHQSEPPGRETRNAIGPSGPQSGLLGLQRMLGNQAVSQLLRSVTGTSTSAGIVVHRKCDSCAKSGGKCEGCQKKREPMLHRSHSLLDKQDRGESDTAPLIVNEVLQSPGVPLDSHTRDFFEPRFGHEFSHARRGATAPSGVQGKLTISQPGEAFEQEADQTAQRVMRKGPASVQSMTATPPSTQAVLENHSAGSTSSGNSSIGPDLSQVRIHTDARAAQSARSVDALAYTVGNHVVFGSGLYRPQTFEGQMLLAHELTHVVQQGPGVERVFRKRADAEFGEDKLQKYLEFLDKGAIEDNMDSDDKARAIVNTWKLGGSSYVLTAKRKALMIKEMQSGFTGDDDEQAILEILERSYNFELKYIFGGGGVTADDLNSDFHTKEWGWLKDFYGRRFEGGMEALKKGVVKPRGLPVRLGEPMAVKSDWQESDVFLSGTTEWNVPCLLGILCQEDKAVVNQLPGLTVQKADTVTEVYWEFDGKTWEMKTRQRGAFSQAEEKVIGLKTSATCAIAARHIIHEVHHQNQPGGMKPNEVETDAYTFEEDWSIKRGLPGVYRTTKDTGEEIPDVKAIEQHVKKRYSGASADKPEERVIDHTAAGKAKVLKPDGKKYERKAVKGESHQDFEKTKANLEHLPKVDPKEWVCPGTKKAK
jgi:uncharacterized protein DUF4157